METQNTRSIFLALITGAPIGFLCGLIGLGGAEFRLPVLIDRFKYSIHKAISLNIAVSGVTILASVFFRLSRTNIKNIYPLWSLTLMFVITSMVGSYLGANIFKKITEKSLKNVLLVLLIFVGILLITQGFYPFRASNIKYTFSLIAVFKTVSIGMVIGIISSLLSVAGGELTIPSLMILFGIDIKFAGTVSLLINLPSLIVGICKHASNREYCFKKDIKSLIIPMGIGSVIGSLLGAFLIKYVPSSFMKILLGFLLISSVIKLLMKQNRVVENKLLKPIDK